jgi:hypothetical protein
MSPRYNPPPNWPPPPAGWTPPPGWQPDPAWGPPPEGWQLWTDAPHGSPWGASAAAAPDTKKGSWFGRHKVLTGVAAVAALVVLIGIAGGGEAEADDAPAKGDAVASVAAPGGSDDAPAEEGKDGDAAPAEKPADTTPGLNSAVRDGKFEFTVTQVEPGVKSVGSHYSHSTAQGQFVLVHVTVRNIGDRPQRFSDDNQKLLNASGQQFSSDSTAAGRLDADTWVEINPGNSIDTIVVFDIPADMVPAAIQLHDSAFSRGVRVPLS